MLYLILVLSSVVAVTFLGPPLARYLFGKHIDRFRDSRFYQIFFLNVQGTRFEKWRVVSGGCLAFSIYFAVSLSFPLAEEKAQLEKYEGDLIDVAKGGGRGCKTYLTILSEGEEVEFESGCVLLDEYRDLVGEEVVAYGQLRPKVFGLALRIHHFEANGEILIDYEGVKRRSKYLRNIESKASIVLFLLSIGIFFFVWYRFR